LSIALNRKDFSIEGRNPHPAERLQGMHRSDRRAALPERIENIRAQRPAGVQNDFTAQFLSADACQILGYLGHTAVGRSNQDNLCSDYLTRQESMRVTGSDGSYDFARGRLAARHYRADLPSQLTQATSQRAAYATCTDDRKAPWHYMLG